MALPIIKDVPGFDLGSDLYVYKRLDFTSGVVSGYTGSLYYQYITIY